MNAETEINYLNFYLLPLSECKLMNLNDVDKTKVNILILDPFEEIQNLFFK